MIGRSVMLEPNAPTIDWAVVIRGKRRNAVDGRLKRFYKACIDDRRLRLSELSFVALDLETTGLDPQRDEILSLGLVPFNLERIYCSEAGYWVVRPASGLDEESVVIHGITHSAIDQAPAFEKILEPLLEGLAGRVPVVHYRQLERSFLEQAVEAVAGESLLFPMLDTMALEAFIQRRRTSGLRNRWRGRKPHSVRLAETRARYGLPLYQQHHALTDAIATAELFQAQIAYHFSPRTRIGELWL